MPAVSTSVMIGAIVTYLGNKLAKNESVNSFFDDFSEATVNWIKPLFIKDDGLESAVMQELTIAPTDEDAQAMMRSKLNIELKRNPEAEQYIKEIFEKINQTEEGAKIVQTISFSGDGNNTFQDLQGNDITINK